MRYKENASKQKQREKDCKRMQGRGSTKDDEGITYGVYTYVKLKQLQRKS